MSVDEPQSAVSASSAMPHHLSGPIMEEEVTPEGKQCFEQCQHGWEGAWQQLMLVWLEASAGKHFTHLNRTEDVTHVMHRYTCCMPLLL